MQSVVCQMNIDGFIPLILFWLFSNTSEHRDEKPINLCFRHYLCFEVYLYLEND